MSCTNEIPYGAGMPTDMVSSILADNTYSPTKPSTKVEHGKTELQRAYEVLDFFISKNIPGTQTRVPIEFAIAVSGVWGAESGIETWRYMKEEHDNGFAYKDKHAPNAKTFKYGGEVYYYDQANMMKFGYGKGVAQWSWDRVLKFRDWYRGSGGVTTPGVTMDDWGANITGTSVETQTAFAWYEMSQRTGEFLSVLKNHPHKSATGDPEGFKNNIIVFVDAVLRGFENGGVNKMASTKDIDKYTWAGGYKGSMLTRVNRALGIYEEIKNDSRYAPYLN